MTSPALVLVVDDEQQALDLAARNLSDEGYQVITAYDGPTALREMYQNRPALVLLDLGLQNSPIDGFTVCERIREISDVPIIMLTGRKSEEDIVRSLDLGADDYITKPFKKAELLARVRANLRRSNEPPPVKSQVNYSDGYLLINLDERRVVKNGEPVRLTPTEFNMLALLIKNAPRIVSYREMLEKVWGPEYVDDIDYLRVYVWHLRRKIEDDPREPIYIANELGVGYRFERRD